MLRRLFVLMLALLLPLQGVLAMAPACERDVSQHDEHAGHRMMAMDQADMDCCCDPVDPATDSLPCDDGNHCGSSGLSMSLNDNGLEPWLAYTQLFSLPVVPLKDAHASSIWRPPSL